MSISLTRTLPALMAFAIGAAAAQTPSATPRSEITINSQSPARSIPNAILPRISFSPGLIIVRSPSGGGGVANTSDSSDLRLTAPQPFYRNGLPVEFYDHFAPQPDIFGDLALNLHLPGVKSSISMGGGEVALNGGMMSMARSAGLAEAHLEIATLDGRFSIAVQGRALYARSPLMATPFLSTANWVVTERPAFSAAFHF